MKTIVYIVRTENFDGQFVTCGMFPTMKQAQTYAEKMRCGGGYGSVWVTPQDIQPGKGNTMSFNFKLKVGSVVKLKETIPGIHKCDDWKTGLYRVKNISALGCVGKDKEDPRRQSYNFEKIKKDGTVYKSFNNGYRCQAWDSKIDEGKVEIVSV